MTLNYQLTLDDWLEAAKTMKNNHELKRYSVLLVILCGILGIGSYFTNDVFYRNMAMSIMAFAVLFLSFTTFGLRIIWSRALKSNPDTLRPVTVEANREELYFQRPDAESRIKWQKYTRFRETPNLFVLHWSPKIFQLVPKRAFANENELDQFRAWASQIGHEPAPNSPLPEIK